MHLRRSTWSATQKQQVRDTAGQALRQFILDAQLVDGPIDWTLDDTVKDSHVQLYTGKTSCNAVVFACARRIRGTLAQAASICQVFPTTHHFDALESVAVASLDGESSHHHVGVTWMSMKVASTATAQHRDACVLEVRDMFALSKTGAKGFASHLQSIDLPECPPMDAYQGLVRMHIQHTGYTFTEISPGVLNVVCCIHVDFRGTLPSMVARRFMKKRVLTMSAQLNMYFKLMQAATSSAATLHNVVSTKQCASCFRPFKTFESKRSCATCYERVCKACLTTGFVAEYNKVLPVCVRCVLKDAAATHDGKSSSDAPRSSQDSVSSTRSATHHPPRSIVSRVAPQTYKILQLDDDDDEVDMMEPRDTQSFILDDEPDKPELDTVLDHRHKLIRLDGWQHCHGSDQSTPTKSNQGDDRAVTSSVASTLVESRLSILSDDREDAMSSVVWHDAISKFHRNLRLFKETMHHSRRVPTPTHRHSSCSYPHAPAHGVWLASSNSVP